MLIKLKAKVLLSSEEQMENEEKYDLGNIAKSKEWVWRNIAISVDEVYKVIEYNKSKTIIQTYDGEKMLISETFEEVFKKWDDLRKQTGMIEEVGDMGEEPENKELGEDEEEEE